MLFLYKDRYTPNCAHVHLTNLEIMKIQYKLKKQTDKLIFGENPFVLRDTSSKHLPS